MRSIFIFILFVALLHKAPCCQAQKENNIWLINILDDHPEYYDLPNTKFYLDFNQDNGKRVHPIEEFDYSVFEKFDAPDLGIFKFSSVCNPDGALLFSVFGEYIFDKYFNEFPSPFFDPEYLQDLKPRIGYTIDHFIVQKPRSPEAYYIFSVLSQSRGDRSKISRIYVTEVDMSLNGGKGDIRPGGNMRLLVDSINTGIHWGNNPSYLITKGDCHEFWFLLIGKSIYEDVADNLNLYAYKIDESGISGSPVITPLDFPRLTTMSMGSDRTKIAISGYGQLRLYDFHSATGIIDNPRVLASSYYFDDAFSHILEFSSNGRNLITIESNAVNLGWLVLYDIAKSSMEEIIASKRTISDSFTRYNTSAADLNIKAGPNHNLYQSATSSPDGYRTNARLWSIDNINYGSHIFINRRKLIASETSSPGIGAYSYPLPPDAAVWPAGDVFIDPQIIPFCSDTGSITLYGQPNARSYTWSTGATTESITGIPGHTYWVRSEICDAIYHDTFILQVTPHTERGINTIENDICAGAFLTLKANGEPDADYAWTNERGDTLGTKDSLPISIYYPGSIYLQETTPLGCTYSDFVSFTTTPCCEVLIPNSFSPNGDGLNDRFGIVAEADKQVERFHIYNRYGQLVFKGHNARETWDGTSGGAPAATGTYFFMIQYRCYGNEETLHTRKGEVTLIR